jgi:hypothetical protein
MIPKEISQIPNIYFKKRNNKFFEVLIRKYESPVLLVISLFPMLTTELLHLVLYFSKNIIILSLKYVVDIRGEAWLNLFWECINLKLFAV